MRKYTDKVRDRERKNPKNVYETIAERGKV